MSMVEKIKTVILCGGIGNRLFPLTTDKSLLSFNGRPLIYHQVKCAISAGLDEFIIVVNKANRIMMQRALSGMHNASIKYILQKEAGGMAHALMTARKEITQAPFLLLSANDIVDKSAYVAILEKSTQFSSAAAILTAKRLTSYFPGGYLVISRGGRIKHIVEKPGRGNEPSNLINIVMHLHLQPRQLFKYLGSTAKSADDDYEKALDKMIGEGHRFQAVIYPGIWQTIKYPWHILEAMDYYAAGIRRKISARTYISPLAVIDGEVIMEEGVRVLEGAVIRGPTYIGKNTIIGNNVLIRNSTIGKGNVIGYKTEIKHSYINNNCWFHSNYIGDSVIGDNCSFGAGAITANFRFDENTISSNVQGKPVITGHDKLGTFIGENTRIGVNASIMPGIKIGTNCSIGPQVCLNRDIEPDSTIIQDTQYILRHNAGPKIKRSQINSFMKERHG